MRHLYTVLFLAFAGVLSLNAQNRTFSQIPHNYTLDVNSVSRNAAAEFVLPNTDPCFTDSLPSLFTYGGGYYGEKQKAQLYYLDPATYAGATIDSVRAAIYTTVNNNVSTPLYATIFDFDTTTGSVGATLGVSDALTIGAAYSNFPFAEFKFSTPVQVSTSGYVLVSVSIPDVTAGDTALVFSSNPALGCTQSYLNAWEQYPTSTVPDYWAPIAYSWGGGDPAVGPNCDWHIFPKVTSSGTAVFVGEERMERLSVFPNPAEDRLWINNAEGSEISVYNLVGSEVLSFVRQNNSQVLNVASLVPGSYILVEKNSTERNAYRFQVK